MTLPEAQDLLRAAEFMTGIEPAPVMGHFLMRVRALCRDVIQREKEEEAERAQLARDTMEGLL